MKIFLTGGTGYIEEILLIMLLRMVIRFMR